jgi:methylated-DNA-[protein]-cysteine S-methyltransferase
MFYQEIASPFGQLALLWAQDEERVRITHILIPSPKRSVAEGLRAYAGAVVGRQPQVDELCARLARYLEGEVVELPLDLLDRAACTPFQWQVLMAEKAIPRGEVRTYAQVAAAAGCPRGARAAGNALARNPFPIVIPCHRAVRSDGSLGGYYGGLAMKRALLEMEGVTLDARGRAALRGG